jgi:serine phosphatase RsbU (regulator of sigma subunit)
MRISKPEDMDESNEPEESADTTTSQPEPTVELEYRGGMASEMTMSEAIGVHQEALNQPESFGIAAMQSVRELRDRVEQLERQNAELREVVEAIHEGQHNVAEQIGWDVDYTPIPWEEF